MSLIETRGHQLFPKLDPAQVETAKRFAPARRLASTDLAAIRSGLLAFGESLCPETSAERFV